MITRVHYEAFQQIAFRERVAVRIMWDTPHTV